MVDAYILAILAGIVIGGARVYQVFWHPEWTEAQSLLNLWPWYGLGVWLVVLFIIIVIRENS